MSALGSNDSNADTVVVLGFRCENKFLLFRRLLL